MLNTFNTELYGGGVVSTVGSQQRGFLACSPHVCVDSPHIRRLPPIVQKHAR